MTPEDVDLMISDIQRYVREAFDDAMARSGERSALERIEREFACAT